jgi:SNF2 family DNA or RNA helicase
MEKVRKEKAMKPKDEKDSGDNRLNSAHTCLLTLILRLRQACCSPKMVIDSMKRLQQQQQQKKKRTEGREGKEEESDEDDSDDEDGEGFGVEDVKNAIKRLKFYTGEENKDEFKECTVCLDNDATHSAIPCAHTLCEDCWEKLLVSGELKCPVCRRSVKQYQPVVQTLTALNEILEDKELIEHAEENVMKCFEASSSTKIKKALEIMASEPDHKFLIVSQWTKALDAMEQALAGLNPKIKYVRVDGQVTPAKRYDIISEFQNPENNIRLCLVSLSASSEGVTMTEATRVIHLDPWWNDAKDYQMSNRIHRIGQKKDVKIYRLLAKNTIEDKVMNLRNKKKMITDVAFGDKKVQETMNWANNVKLMFSLNEDPLVNREAQTLEPLFKKQKIS